MPQATEGQKKLVRELTEISNASGRRLSSLVEKYRQSYEFYTNNDIAKNETLKFWESMSDTEKQTWVCKYLSELLVGNVRRELE